MPETIGVDLTGSASGFVSAINSAMTSMDRFEKKAESLGAVGGIIRRNVLPVATAIGSAFAANKALTLFSESALPGAKLYTEALDRSKKALTSLGAAVGEYLAPAAIRVANLITTIADKLTPLVRQFTAFSRSAGEFMVKLGQNALAAFRALMPTLDDFATRIENLFTGPARDWTKDIEQFRQWWNNTWDSILNKTAPIFVAAADLIEQSFATIKDMAVTAWESVSELLDGMTGKAGDAAGGFADFGASVVTAIGAAEFALKEWRLSADITWTAIKFGFQTVVDVFSTGWQNAVKAMEYFGTETKSLFDELFGQGGYVVKLLKEVFTSYLPELVARSSARASQEFLFRTSFGRIDLRKPFNAPGFDNPDFNFKPGKFPDMNPLVQGDKAAGLSAMLSKLTSSFGDGLAQFLDKKLPGIGPRAQAFIDAIKNGLPNVNADVLNVPVGGERFNAPQDSRFGFASQGSREAYEAIAKADAIARDNKTAKDVAEDHLAEAKRQTKLLQDQDAKLGELKFRGGIAGGNF